MAEPYLGQIQTFGFNFAPTGWMQCNGQLLSIAAYSALFALLGTTYGGNGTTTFGLPDLQGRVAISQGQGAGLSNYVIGEASGSETVTLLSTQMPLHSHAVNAVSGTTGAGTTPTNAVPCQPLVIPNTTHVSPYSTSTANTTMSNTMIGTAGGNQPHNNMQPFLTVNYCIAYVGIFPTRG
jgi:microcystin-dependent protein